MGDRRALPHRPGLRRVRRVARQRVDAEGPVARIRRRRIATRSTSYVVDIQDKAVELFTAGYQKAIQMQVYDEYTAKIREALGRLAADKFPPERESRSRERIGDRPPTPESSTEVAR